MKRNTQSRKKGKGIHRAGKGKGINSAGEGIVRADERNNMDF